MELSKGIFAVAVICDNLTAKNQESLEHVINHLNHKPAILLIRDNNHKSPKLKDSLAWVCHYHSAGGDPKESILLSIEMALKRHELMLKNQELLDIINRSKSNQNIIDLTLSYNHEINNLLTMIIGQAQLLLQGGDLEKKNANNKLIKIEGDAQKIRQLALDLTDNINTASVIPANKTTIG